jgi:dipeptidyl aminopeptidase/acylaminoacyl peptidase
VTPAPLVRLLILLMLTAAGCTATGEPDSSTEARSAPTSRGQSVEPTDRGGTQTTAPPESTPPEPAPSEPSRPEPKPHPVSVAALIETELTGGRLRVGEVLEEAGSYTRYAVTYRSQGLSISGIMNVPSGRGPFPVLVLSHGYIDPVDYETGQGLAREQDWLARRGYVVLHTDYRNHAGSDDDPNVDYELRLPYAVDVVNAVRAVKRSGLRFLDGDRVGLLGRSMGGSVTLNALVARPGSVDAAVVYASTSSLAADNWRQFYRGDGDRARVNARMQRTYGLPGESPRFWRRASARPYFDRVSAPVLLHHGTLDDTCPIGWSRATVRALRETGNRARLIPYRGEGHTMYSQWERSMEHTAAFLGRHLR